MSNQLSIACCPSSGQVSIVQGTMQRLHELYPAQTAIRRGTLFPELDKPMNCASSPSGCAEPTCEQERAFSAWEIRLYLDTHPCDEHALQLYHQLCEQCACCNYACAFVDGGNGWNWVDDPWPWEVCANERKA